MAGGGLHDARHRWRLPVLLVGMLFARGRRTVTTWLRAAGISDDYDDYYYFLASVGRKSESVATQLAGAGAADVPSARAAVGSDRRLADQAVRAQGRRSRHPSQSDARTGRPEVPVRPHLGHDFAGGAAPAVGRAGVAAAGDAVCSPADDGHDSPPSRLEVPHQARTGGAAGGVDRSDR